MIGAAIGIVMAAHHVSEVEAFAILNRASQNTNRKLRALADDVVTSGDASGLPST
jgi:AmiR/NasT family two-component response regulator